jgi:hypothetical protein
MRDKTLLILVAVAAIFGVIYLGGVIVIKGAPIFAHMDHKLSTTAFMRTHYRLMSVFGKKAPSTKEDPFTKQYQDFDKVLEKNVQ